MQPVQQAISPVHTLGRFSCVFFPIRIGLSLYCFLIVRYFDYTKIELLLQ